MKHCIIGNGSIGKRYEKILTSFGDMVTMLDIDWDIDKIGDVDSILICTPPQTHLSILDQIHPSNPSLPVFIEKPLYSGSKEEETLYKRILELSGGVLEAHVSCNYRFSKAYQEDIRFVEYGYIYKTPYSYLDLIHMVDLCWERYGKPDNGWLGSVENIHNLTMLWNTGKFINVTGNNQSGVKYGRLNGHNVDVSDMYENQLLYWKDFVRGRTSSVNSLNKAYERTKWLVDRKFMGDK